MSREIDDIAVRLPTPVVSLMLATGTARSNNEALPLVEQSGVCLDDRRVELASEIVDLSKPAILRVGRRRFARIVSSG